MHTTVGMVGLGNAGSAMATALSGQVALLGYDVNPERRRSVASLVMECVDSLADLGQRATAIVLSLPRAGNFQSGGR